MRLVMVGLDHTTADMTVREVFSPDPAKQRDILAGMAADEVLGCVLMATCNRTELYISHRGDVPPDGVALLCRGLGVEARDYRRHFVERSERQAVQHLMRVAAGMASSVPGDDQIVTQVRAAVETAREAGTADPLLEALFRAAVAAGKKVKTRVRFARAGASVAGRAIEIAAQRLGGLAGRTALVIGNGVVGRLAASALLAEGCDVAMTFRDARRQPDIPPGCRPVEFDSRASALKGRDIVVGATSSPRCVLGPADLEGSEPPPRLFLDLAAPRDFDPAIGDLPGATLLNVDDLRQDGEADEALRRQFAAADDIIGEEVGRFDAWRRNRRRRERGDGGAPDFPIFINLHGATVLIAGGGKVAARRAEKLLGFGAAVHVVSPAIAPEMARLLDRNGLRWTREAYRPAHMEGITLAIAATDDREVNGAVGRDARERGILVSVADRREECSFYFPAIVQSDLLTAGVISNNGDHAMVRRAAARLLEEMETIDADYQSGEPRQ